jgi:hypothetical protein
MALVAVIPAPEASPSAGTRCQTARLGEHLTSYTEVGRRWIRAADIVRP